MILAFLTRLSPAARWSIAGVLAIIAVAALILWLQAREKADDTHNQQIGATAEREASQAVAIEQGVKANAAEQEVRSNPDAALAECLRHARNREDC